MLTHVLTEIMKRPNQMAIEKMKYHPVLAAFSNLKIVFCHS